MNRNCFILHIEDDANDVYFVSRALRDSGVDIPVEVAQDGQSAVNFLEEAGQRAHEPQTPKPRLVILDLNLPHKSGFEVLEWIRRHSKWKTLVVLVLTSSTSEADMHQSYLLGANAYLIKPSDATKLRELGRLLKEFWLGWNQPPPPCRE